MSESKVDCVLNNELISESNTKASEHAVCEKIAFLNVSLSRDPITDKFLQINCKGRAAVKYGNYSMVCLFESVDHAHFKYPRDSRVMFEVTVEKIIEGHLDHAIGSFITDVLQMTVPFDIDKFSSEKAPYMKAVLRDKLFGGEMFAEFIDYHIM